MSEAIRGPKAPKDPTKKRPSFFIIRNKKVAGSPQPDGRGIQFIYSDDGRMINSAKITGGITDEEILSLLRTTEGFRKLVHSIGVSVAADDKDLDVTFALQMYGKTNKHGGGTTITKVCKANDMENIITLDEIDFSDDDDIPGQIRFEFEKSGLLATVNVRLILNDGYTAPEVEDEYPVDFSSDAYTEMIDKSLMNTGNNVRLKRAFEKAEKGEDVTISFIGGSITQGAGAIPINTECYAYKTFKGFCDLTGRSYNDNVHYCKAGVGGTPSELGMLRYDRDVREDEAGEPDIVVVEFAVNDEGDETKGVCYDSLVRKIWNGPSKPAVILIFAVFADDFNLQDRLSPVGYAYNLPMVSTKNSVTDQFYLKMGEGKLVSKSQYFYDIYHPSNTGHTIMADGIISLMKKVYDAPYDEQETDINSIDAPLGKTFESVRLLDRKDNDCNAKIDMGSFSDIDDNTQGVERNLDLHQTKEFAHNFMYKGREGRTDNNPFVLDIECKSLLFILKDSGEMNAGKADVYVDGIKKITADPREVGWNHCSPVIIVNDDTVRSHHVEVKMHEEDLDKEFTILGFGFVNDTDCSSCGIQ